MSDLKFKYQSKLLFYTRAILRHRILQYFLEHSKVVGITIHYSVRSNSVVRSAGGHNNFKFYSVYCETSAKNEKV